MVRILSLSARCICIGQSFSAQKFLFRHSTLAFRVIQNRRGSSSPYRSSSSPCSEPRFYQRRARDLSCPSRLELQKALPAPDKLILFDTWRAYNNSIFGLPLYFGISAETPVEPPKANSTTSVSSMSCLVEVSCAPTVDTPASCLLLQSGTSRYIFGQVAEGTQRAMAQNRFAYGKADSIFISGPTGWKNHGGLIGLILSIAGVMADNAGTKLGVRLGDGLQPEKTLNIYGGENLSFLLATARRFIFRQSLKLRVHEVRGDPTKGANVDRKPDFEDDNIKVWNMPIWPDQKSPPEDVQSSSSQESQGSQKRSWDEMSEESNQPDFTTMKEDEKHNFVKEVLAHMFESNWTIHSVVETVFGTVAHSAQAYVKDADGKLVKYMDHRPGDPDAPRDLKVWVRKPWPGAKVSRLPPAVPSFQSLCYFVRTLGRRGKFKPDIAKQYGVKMQDFKKLTAGQSVEGANGVTVTCDMVLGDPLPAVGFAVLDVPDQRYIDPLLRRIEMSDEALKERVNFIYWFLGRGVAADPRIVKFIEAHPELKHVISAIDVVPNYPALESPARMNTWLHMTDAKRFPLMHFTNTPEVATLPKNAVMSMPRHTVNMVPRFEYKPEKMVEIKDLEEVRKDYPEGCKQLAQQAGTVVADPEFRKKVEAAEKDIPNRDAELITLGTGSAVPSKYRNVSSTLLRVPGVGSYLFDCGENTIGQMRRLFGPELPDILRSLRLIWISHLHADHHLGLASVLKAWHEETRDMPSATLDLVSHFHMANWLDEYSDIEDIGWRRGLRTGRVKFIALRAEQSEVRSRKCRPVVFAMDEDERQASERNGLTRIDAVFVNHCAGAVAGVMTFPSGFKVAYSGDCRPSQDFATIARGTTLLIHEATLADEFAADAIAKKHCTISEAMSIARSMRARRVMLTHFSQRYPKIAEINDVVDTTSDDAVRDQAVLFAFDGMRVKLGEWREAQEYWPAIKELISDD